MDTEKCTVLLTAIDQGSLSGAAEVLGYTPSGVSRLVASLEADLGLPLLTRSKGGVTPTPECEALRPRLAELATLGRACREEAAAVRGLEAGSLTVGSAYRPLYRALAATIAAFSAEHPGIQVRIEHANSSTLAAGMARRAIDFSLMSRREIDCRWTPLAQDAMVAVVPPDHALAHADAFPIERLLNEAFIELYPGEDCDNSRTLTAAGIRPRAAYTAHDTSAAFALVEAGLGIALMNDIYARSARVRVAVVPLAPTRIVEIGIAVPPGRPSPALAAFEAFAIPRLQKVSAWNLEGRAL